MKYPYGCKVSIPYENEHGDAAYFDVSLNSPVDHRRVKRILRTILRRSGLRSCDRTIRLLMTRS